MYFFVSLAQPSLELCIFWCKGLLGRRREILSLRENRSRRELMQVFNENEAKLLSLLFDKLLVLLFLL